MKSLKFIEEVDDASAGGGGFPSLEELTLWAMDDLEGWSTSSSTPIPAAAVFPCLKRVEVGRCPRLRGGIPLAWSPLQDVKIDGRTCNGMVLGSLRNLPSLPFLEISWFAELEYFPSGALTNLTALHKLGISYCHDLKALPVELISLVTLTELEISHCSNLVSLAEEREGGLKNLSSLKTLVITYCGALKRLPELEKASLVTLRILDCPAMEFSKEDFEHLLVLEHLQLHQLPRLTWFLEGIKHSSLKTLHIEYCIGLKRLPELDKASLVTLKIRHCPAMEFSKEDFEHLLVLEELQLFGLCGLTWFPEGIKHSAATLTHLKFRLCYSNCAPVDLPDWIGTTLTSLEYLEIDAARNWKMLPQWIQHLTALKSLQIWQCDKEIVERWKTSDKQREEDYFNMIAHLPDVNLTESYPWEKF